jgi:hypothetical protein
MRPASTGGRSAPPRTSAAGSGWDLAFAYEALARASRVAGDEEAVRDYVRKAREAGEQIGDQEDREHFESDIAQLES